MKSRTAAIAWAFFLGGVGAHKFYLRQPLWGVLYATFFWTWVPAIVALIEVIILLCTTDEAFSEKYN